VVGRLSNITLTEFDIRLQEEETHKTGHYTDETVTYIAWEPSSGDVDGMSYIVDSTFDEVTHSFYNISFYPVFDSAPVFVADMQTTDGGDTANVRWQNKTSEGIEVQINEEQSNDTEVTHTTEVVGYICFSKAFSESDVDNDGDGYTVSQGDCNDADASIHPGAEEICGDGIDQNCDGTDELCPEDIDDDGDGYTENQGDCNDSAPLIHPGAEEICGDGIDQDCDGSDELCPEDIDNDGDGYTENEGDCNDSDASIYPGAEEVCGDGIDQDCNGSDLQCDRPWWWWWFYG